MLKNLMPNDLVPWLEGSSNSDEVPSYFKGQSTISGKGPKGLVWMRDDGLRKMV